MDSDHARELFVRYNTAVAYVDVETPTGDRLIGSAFHVGDGVFVTARHVVENNRIVEVGTTEHAHLPLEGADAERTNTFLHIGEVKQPVHRIAPGPLEIEVGPVFHSDPRVDVAAFRVANDDSRRPAPQLGGHYDDWIGESDFVLWDAVVLGYPPIPLSSEPHLVAARAEVNAILTRYDNTPHVHFILSATARGGFSGGVAMMDGGMVLGLITTSLVNQGQPEELGYLTVVSVEPIYVCLDEHGLLPDAQDLEKHYGA